MYLVKQCATLHSTIIKRFLQHIFTVSSSWPDDQSDALSIRRSVNCKSGPLRQRRSSRAGWAGRVPRAGGSGHRLTAVPGVIATDQLLLINGGLALTPRGEVAGSAGRARRQAAGHRAVLGPLLTWHVVMFLDEERHVSFYLFEINKTRKYKRVTSLIPIKSKLWK